MRTSVFASGKEEQHAWIAYVDLLLQIVAKDDKESEKEAVGALQALEKDIMQKEAASEEMDLSQGMPISYIARSYDLYDYTFLAFLLAYAPSIDEKYALIYKELREDDENARNVTFALLDRLYLLLHPERRAVPTQLRSALLESPVFVVSKALDGASYLFDKFSISPLISELLLGNYAVPTQMERYIYEWDGEEQPSPMIVLDTLAERLHQYVADVLSDGADRRHLIHVRGRKSAGRHVMLMHALAGERIVFVRTMQLLKLMEQRPEDGMQMLQSILLRSEVLAQQLVFEEVPISQEYAGILKEIVRTVFAMRRLLFVITGSDADEVGISIEQGYSYAAFTLPELTTHERLRLWEFYGSRATFAKEIDIEMLASQYTLTAGQISKAISLANDMRSARGEDEISLQDIKDAILSFNPVGLSKLATKIQPAYHWDDLILAEDQKEILKVVCAQVRYQNYVNEDWGFGKKLAYGKGISLLMYGAPGTGKTMAAQILARELGMELYRVDLSRMVDKYIGETEKNIGQVFDLAKTGNFILFFDEADALFSKRTEVTSSNDKHANTETAYLLQKMEAHDGITILATNLYKNFDEAFMRRITYGIRFEKPDAQTKMELFDSMLPKEMPTAADLDFSFFAENFEFTGSGIKALIYHAAILAASENMPLGQRHLVKALSYEYRKNGKLLLRDELGKYALYL